MKDIKIVLQVGLIMLPLFIVTSLIEFLELEKTLVINMLRFLIMYYTVILLEQTLQLRKYKQNRKKGLTNDERTNDI